MNRQEPLSAMNGPSVVPAVPAEAGAGPGGPAGVFGALSDATRRAIFECLIDHRLSVGEVAERMPVTRAAVSQHLRVLKLAGLVSERREGRRTFYEVSSDGLQAIRHYVAHLERRMAPAQLSTDPEPACDESRCQADKFADGLIEEDIGEDLVAGWVAIAGGQDPATVALLVRIQLVARAMDVLLGQVASAHGLNPADVMTLGTLRRMGTPYQATPGQLARSALVTPPAMAKRIDRLLCLGLIQRVANPADRRSCVVRLTDAGLRTFQQVSAKHLAANSMALFALPAQDRSKMAEIFLGLLRHFHTRAVA